MYCQVAEEGGGTTFTNSDIFVKPTRGMATFFSYKNMKTGEMDDGDTQHSGCPVLRGEKWITTVWMREGVDEHNVWSGFDPQGLPIIHELQGEIEPIHDGNNGGDNKEEKKGSSGGGKGARAAEERKRRREAKAAAAEVEL